MGKYVVKRFFLMIPTLLGVAVLIFVLMRVVPGDVVELRLAGDSGAVSEELLKSERARFGLDQPLWKQFATWMWGVVQLDFGTSMWTGASIGQEIKLRFALSLQLAIMATAIGVALAIPLGVASAVKQDSWVDYVARVVSIAGGCICCSFGSDLMGALMTIARRESRPDHVLIETSGVALPGSVARSATLISDFSLDCVVVLADAETVRGRAADRYMGDTITRQLHEADLVLLNKTDLVSANELDDLRAWVKREAPHAAQIESVRGQMRVDLLLGFERGGALRASGALSAGAMHSIADAGVDYASETIFARGAIDVATLACDLARADAGLIRAKGVLLDMDGALKTVHIVGRRWEVTPCAASGRTGPGLSCIGLRGRMDPDNLKLLFLKHQGTSG